MIVKKNNKNNKYFAKKYNICHLMDQEKDNAESKSRSKS